MRLVASLFVLFFYISVIRAYRYVITTYTGDRFGAGTDARVFVKLFGLSENTGEKELKSSGRDNFERGQIDTFLLDAKNVGIIKKAEIRHDNSWLGPGWFLEKLTATSEGGDYYEFPVHKWLDKHQDDGKTSRELIPKATPKQQITKQQISKKNEIENDEPRQPLDCSWPQGIGNGNMPDSQISASTSFNDLHLPYHGRLGVIAPNSLGGWCPYKDGTSEYLQFDLAAIKKTSGIATQGMGLVDEWTTAYRLAYSNKSDSNFKEYSLDGNGVKSFVANDDQNGTVLHWLRKPFVARYVRVSPLKWHGKGCLRAELYGCPAGPDLPEVESNVPTMQQSVQHVSTLQMEPIKSKLVEQPRQPPENNGNLLYHNVEQNSDEMESKSDDMTAQQHHIDEQEGATRSLSIQLTQAENGQNEVSIDIIPVAHLDFDEVRDNVIPDVSGHHNDARFRRPVDLLSFSKSCQRGLRLNGGDVFFDGEFFIDKPREEITVASWVKLFSNGGQHSIFDTVGGKDSAHKEGQYHFEVDRGRLRWFHRNEAKDNVFNISSPLMIPSHVWTHCAATYSSITGKVAVFVNGKLGAQGYGIGSLSQDWTGRAGIGNHKGQRILNGEIDEFYIFNKALTPSKIEMLMRRCSFETECQGPLGMQSKNIQDSQIFASTTYNLHKPFYARINLASFAGDPARTAWCAVKDDKNPYLEIELPEMTSLTGVATQGLSIFDNWVTSYLFCYSDNRAVWDCYKEKGYDKIFEANTDKNSVRRHYFHHPVDGKYVRIRPQSWYGNHLCLRVELYGCIMDLLPDPYDSFGSLPVFMEDTEAQARTEISPKEACNNPLGVSNGEVDDMHLTVSSSLDETYLAYYGRLVRESIDQSDIKGCWCARDVNLRQYIEADLGEVKTITGIATQGYVAHDNWVGSYRLGYSDDSNALEWYRERDDERLFLGNTDRTSIVKHFLKHPVQARYIRINPRAWHGIHICMRFEVFGCKEGPQKQPELDSIYLRNHLHHPHVSNEHAEDKHIIPKKSEKHHSTADRLRSQVKAHSHEVKRLKPGHGTHGSAKNAQSASSSSTDEILQVSYPKPKILRPPLRNLTIPFDTNTKPHPPVKLVLDKNNNPKLELVKVDKEKAGEVDSHHHNKLDMKNEQDVLLAVNKLQELSDDKVSAELKGSILQLAKEKLMEDLQKKLKEEKCKKGYCPTDIGTSASDGWEQMKNTNTVDMASLYPVQNTAVYPQYTMQQKPTPLIDAPQVLANFPELRQNGITEDVLESLAARVPNLEQRIYAHFAMKSSMDSKNAMRNDLEMSNLAFMKNYKDYMKYGDTKNSLSEAPGNIFPEQHKVEEFAGNSYPMNNLYAQGNNMYGYEKPCTRSGGCTDPASMPESYVYKPPHAPPPKPDVYIKDAQQVVTGYADNTKITPDYLTPIGPDPRYVNYYHNYLEGKDAEPVMPPTLHPPTKLPPPPPPPPRLPYIELTTTAEQLPPVSIQTSFPTQQLESVPPSIPVVEHEVSVQWTPFSVCSASCGRGEKKRFRRCTIPDCPSGGVEIETVPCAEAECTGEDPFSWSVYTPCSATCGEGSSVRYRTCREQNCAVDGYETEQISCYKPNCPICVLDFEVIQNKEVVDQSGHSNNGFLDQHVVLKEHPQICGHYADLTNNGEILFYPDTFTGKPRTGISIACWVNVQGDLSGKHSIFSTIRQSGDNQFIGGYHFELDGGKVRWFHRDEKGIEIFSMLTNVLTLPRVWMHYTVTYDGYKGLAKVFVDGKERGSQEGNGLLAADWGYKASIGYYDFDDRRLNGWFDEFVMYDYPLNEEEVFNLLGKMRCPTGNATTVEIDAFKFENLKVDNHLKRSLNEDEDYYNKIENVKRMKVSEEQSNSKINTKQKLHNAKLENVKRKGTEKPLKHIIKNKLGDKSSGKGSLKTKRSNTTNTAKLQNSNERSKVVNTKKEPHR